jgi:hypothetical protein
MCEVGDLDKVRWFTLNLTTQTRWFNVTVTNRETGYTVFSRSYIYCDPIKSDNYVRLGQRVYSSNPTVWEVLYDNYRLYDLDPQVNIAPIWGELPVLEATEDVPFTYDFSANVTNPDGSLDVLAIESASPYVTTISGLSVTFLFGEGVTEAMVPLVLRDGEHSVPALIMFRVLPVNDPPSHCIPRQLEATEDIPLIFDLGPYVWDVDNPKSDLFLTLEDQYVSAEGLSLVALFPEGVLECRVDLIISDGVATTEAWVEFIIVPVNDPLMFDLPATFTIIEDVPTVLNLALYINDVDTPLEDLRIIEENRHCTLRGTELHFLEERGGNTFGLWVEVWDGDYVVRDNMVVIVLEVNDAPSVETIPDQTLTEHVELTLDLGPYISDEETPDGGLKLLFDPDDLSHRPPQVVAVEGLNLTLRYDEWVTPHVLEVLVSDGNATTLTAICILVEAVNDPPRITMPGEWVIDEGTEVWVPIEVEDEDDEEFMYFVDTSFHGFELADNGTLHVWAAKGEVGQYSALVSVMDMGGAMANTILSLEVRNVNDPPEVPVILAPENGSVHEKGDAVGFEARVDDPDTRFGQVVTVTWSSDREGELTRGSPDRAVAFSRPLDVPGPHRVEVTVNDGEFERSAWVVVEVREPRPEGPPDSWWRTCLVMAVVALVVLLYNVHRMRRKGV